jgi:hypothetical protein
MLQMVTSCITESAIGKKWLKASRKVSAGKSESESYRKEDREVMQKALAYLDDCIQKEEVDSSSYSLDTLVAAHKHLVERLRYVANDARHIVVSPDVFLLHSITSDGLKQVFKGDEPLVHIIKNAIATVKATEKHTSGVKWLAMAGRKHMIDAQRRQEDLRIIRGGLGCLEDRMNLLEKAAKKTTSPKQKEEEAPNELGLIEMHVKALADPTHTVYAALNCIREKVQAGRALTKKDCSDLKSSCDTFMSSANHLVKHARR